MSTGSPGGASTPAGRYPAVPPEQPADCEAIDFSVSCGTGDWVLTIKIGPSGLLACGF